MSNPMPIHELLMPWIENQIGMPLSNLQTDPIPVVSSLKPESHPLTACKLGHRGAISSRVEWIRTLQRLVQNIPMDILFSPFGCAELARVTLTDNYGIWGPNWYFFGDATTLKPYDDGRSKAYTPIQLGRIDHKLFWHCSQEAIQGFGIEEEGELVALAVVTEQSHPVWEIGMDVIPSAKARGLGRSVVSAAANWVVQNNRYVVATVGPFNVPSVRTLRASGLKYSFMTLKAAPGPFQIPPQPLGSPLPDAEVYNYYPQWAMNQCVKPKP